MTNRRPLVVRAGLSSTNRLLGSRFLRTLRHSALLLGLSGCFTASDLRAYGPEKPFYEVCGRPRGLPNAKLWAINEATGQIWSDEDIADLRFHADQATAYYQYEETAPESSESSIPPGYGLTCPTHALAWPDAVPVLESGDELFWSHGPCPVTVAETVGPADRSLLGETMGGKSRCDGKQKYPWRVHVCVRPPNVGDVREWAMTGNIKDNKLIASEKSFAEEVANAKIVFVLDDNAPPESVYWFVTDPTKLECPNKPAPKPYDQVAGSGSLPMMAVATSMMDALASNPKKGDGQTTSTSSPDGKGPPLSVFEKIANNMAIGGALAQGDTSGSLKDANGDRSGIPGGKNVGGFSFPPLQLGVGALEILISAGMSPKSFVDNILKFAKRGQRTLIKEADAKMMKVADELITNHGQFEMAKGLQEMQTIMPFELGQKFTANLGGKFQAHKIFERQAIKELMVPMEGLSKEAIEKAVDEVAKKYPSIILTDAEHTVINAKLAAAWKAQKAKVAKKLTKADLRGIYEDVYRKDYPQWLDAIDSYLR